MNETILQVKHLKKAFCSKGQIVRAVDDVSFYVKRGETFALVGESGCGKTTTGRLILQLLRSDSGEIIFKGKDICRLKKREIKKLRPSIQIVFQDPYGALNPKMKIRKLLSEAVLCSERNGKNIENIICELIKSVGLQIEDLDRYPHEFSGGQRQRICIARAIATQPDLIICDEPVSALDLLVQAQILNLLKELQLKYSLSYIFISHDLSVVRYMSDRIAVMCMGKIVEEGTKEEIFTEPSHIYTKLLLESFPQIEDTKDVKGIDKTYYDDKYREAIKYVSEKSVNIKQLSKTHYVLNDI